MEAAELEGAPLRLVAFQPHAEGEGDEERRPALDERDGRGTHGVRFSLVSLLGAKAQSKPRGDRARYLRGWEHRREADEAVEVNLTPDQLAIREYEAQPYAATPCRPPFRFRVREACSGLIGKGRATSGKTVDVPCREPFRFRTKDYCEPKERRWVPPVEEQPHAFEGLL